MSGPDRQRSPRKEEPAAAESRSRATPPGPRTDSAPGPGQPEAGPPSESDPVSGADAGSAAVPGADSDAISAPTSDKIPGALSGTDPTSSTTVGGMGRGRVDPGRREGPCPAPPRGAGGPLAWMLARARANPTVTLIFLACLLPEIVLSGADFGLWGRAQWRFDAWAWGGFWIGLLGNWRPNFALQPLAMFVTYGFLHGGIVHFAVNMLTLFSLGPPLARRFGEGRFALLYMVALLGGGIGFALLSHTPQPMVGASGALFGLAGAHVAINYRMLRAEGESLASIWRALAWLAGLNLVLWWAMNGHLAWETHLGGFIAGWLAALWLERREQG